MKQLNLLTMSAIVSLLLACPVASAELSGTLFSSPEQRAYLDFLRQDFLARSQERGFNIAQSDVPEIPGEAAPEVIPPTYTLGGISTRSNGDLVIWLNGQRYNESDLPAGLSAVMQDGQHSLRVTYAGNRYQLKPGQTLDLGSTAGVVENFRYQPASAEPLETSDTETAASETNTAAPEETVAEGGDETPASEPDTDATAESEATITELADSIRALPPESLASLIETLELSSDDEDDPESVEDAEDELE